MGSALATSIEARSTSAVSHIVHIGFPKTSTTTLQSYLRNPGEPLCGIVVPDPRGRNDPAKMEIIKTLAGPDDALFENRLSKMRRYVEEAIVRDGRVVISDEGLSTGCAMSRRLFEAADRERMANRVTQLMPEAHIVIVVREQRSLATSLYADQRYRGFVRESFRAWLDGELTRPYPQSILSHFRYDEVVDLYRSRFGAERVHVLLFEQLQHATPVFCRQLASKVGLDEAALTNHFEARQDNAAGARPKMGVDVWAVRRLAERLRVGDVRGTIKALKWRVRHLLNVDVKPVLDEGSAERVAAYFRDSNRRLAERVDVSLAEHGYSL